jgi:hypothetical protein
MRKKITLADKINVYDMNRAIFLLISRLSNITLTNEIAGHIYFYLTVMEITQRITAIKSFLIEVEHSLESFERWSLDLGNHTMFRYKSSILHQ